MKIHASVFVTNVGKPLANAEKMIEIMKNNPSNLYLFPAYCLTGISCSDLMEYQCFVDEVNDALDKLCEYTENEQVCIATAVAGYENIIIRNGDIIQKGSTIIDGKKIVVAETGDDKGGDILLLPTAMAGYPCIQNDIIEFCADASKTRKCMIAVANQGFGESSADNVYKGFAGIFNRGIIVDFKGQELPQTITAKAEVDQQTGLLYTRPNKGVDKVPYYGKNEPSRYLNELFLLQVQALYTRLAGRDKAYIAIGLDGSIGAIEALLVAEKTMQMRNLPLKNIIVMVKPGTRDEEFANNIGASIVPTTDITECKFSQALAEMADQYDAILVGSQDLTDIALGLNKFGGQMLREYNINASIPKTLIQALIQNPQQQPENSTHLLNQFANEQPLYDLEDFILFFFSKRKAAYSDIKNLCLAVFEELNEDEIIRRLDTFYDNYQRSQPLRSIVFEGANLIGFKLPYFPADIQYELKNR